MLSPALRLPPDATPPHEGGAVCLAFVNTVYWRRGPAPSEQLTDYDALVAVFASRLDPADVRTVRAVAQANPRAATRALKRAIELRESLHDVCVALADGTPPPAADLALLEGWIRRGGNRVELRHVGPAYVARPGPGSGTESLDLPSCEVALSAAALLTSDLLSRLRTCPGPTCGWVFVDTTRNGSRRWCDPAQCGNRERARAHYHRTHAATG